MKKLAENKSFASLTLVISTLLFLYWNLVQNFDVYRIGIIGAAFEMTSIVSILAVFALSFFLIFFLIFNKFKVLKQYYFALAIVSLLIILLFTIYS